MNISLEIFHSSITEIIRDDAQIVELLSDCKFSEGPLWHPAGYLLFSDIPANIICKTDLQGNKETFLENSGYSGDGDPGISHMIGSNALAFSKDGDILVCQHGNHCIAKLDNNQYHSPFISFYSGKPFNSPNDLVVSSRGSVFFSDPPYGLKDEKLNPERFQPVAGVYRWHEDKTELIFSGLHYPNGVCLSPDEKYLYVCSNKQAEPHLMRFSMEDNQWTAQKLCNANGDGMKCDSKGNLYLANEAGILIISSSGERLGLIRLQHIPTNLNWSPDRKSVYITARESVYMITDLIK